MDTQGDAPDITSDEVKFAITAKCLDDKLSQEIEGIMTDRPDGGGYAKLKVELIRVSAEPDSNRVNKFVGSEEMGDKKTSQFNLHLKNLASPSTP